MRSISAALSSHLSGATLTLASMVKITRQDGTVMGFTSCDTDITYQGLTYFAASAFDASTVRGQIASGIDNLEVIGLLKSPYITDVDLFAGRYDGAQVSVFVVNWADLTMGQLTLLTGVIGDATFENGKWTIEFRSLSQYLGQQIAELTTPSCRVLQLGDARCSAPGGGVLPGATNFQFSKTVSSVPSATQINFGADGNPATFYAYGQVTFTSGLNAGISREIQSQVVSPGNAVVNLQEPFPFVVSPGDAATLTAGCDRSAGTCLARFNNLINFRGEPYVPGTDQMLQAGRR